MNSLQEQLLCKLSSNRKVHIALVGGQIAPVYNAIVATSPQLIEVVFSEQTAADIDILKNELLIPIVESQPLSTTNPHKILNRAKGLANKYSEDDIVLNITSGPKSWSYLFGLVFQPLKNVRVVYIDQNNVLWDYKDMSGNLDFRFDMHTQFRLYNNPLVQYTPITDYTESDDYAALQIEKMRKSFPEQFNNLFLVTNKTEKQNLTRIVGERKTYDGSKVVWDKSAKRQDDDTIMSVTIATKGAPVEITLQSPHVFELIFNAGWFEYKIAKLFTRWEKSKEVLLNCSFPARNNAPKNEVDVIVNAGSKIIFVECKTQISSVTDIDKFRSVVKNYGGMGSKGVFFTDSIKKPHAKEKCIQNGLIDVSFSEDFEEEKFFKMLNKELIQLNTK